MSKISEAAALQNAADNHTKLEFASKVLSDEEFTVLYKSYKQLFWAQISFMIVFMVIWFIGCTLGAAFLPVEQRMIPVGFIPVVFIILYPFWLIITQFCFGKIWHKYNKWYRKTGSINELHGIFTNAAEK